MAFEGWYGFSHLKEVKASKEYKKFFKDLEAIVGTDDNIYISTSGDFSKSTKMIEVKITDKAIIDTIMKASKFVQEFGLTRKIGTNEIKTDPKFGTNLILKISGGNRGTGKLQRYGISAKTPTTAQQELGTILWFKAKLNKTIPNLENINKQTRFEFDEEWVYNFEQQYEAFANYFKQDLNKISKCEIYLDSAKNESDIIVTLAKQFGLKDSKDNWNPADIWLMNITQAKIKEETANISSLTEYNKWLEEKFYSREIIGVSLKKVSKGNKGHSTLVDKQKLPDVDLSVNRIVYNRKNSNFIFETKGKPKGFNIRVGTKASSVKTEKDIKFYSEGRMAGTSVQLGAVSAQLLTELYNDLGFDVTKEKAKMFKEPMKYFNTVEKEILKHSAIIDTSKETDVLDSLIDYKVAAFLVFNIKVYLSFSPEILQTLFFSASKMSTISSIHLKIY